ncbi:MAG: hypothetical protein K9G49_14285 [Taibaiella sp.]|nr:hypothetical protein [Taibaiella sp.]
MNKVHRLLFCFSLLLLVVVSLAAIEVRHVSADNKVLSVTSSVGNSSLTGNNSVNNTSFAGFDRSSEVIKKMPVKKVKVRFRAMYCVFQLAQVIRCEHFIFFEDKKLLVSKENFLHDRFAYLFNLRGPPASIS